MCVFFFFSIWGMFVTGCVLYGVCDVVCVVCEMVVGVTCVMCDGECVVYGMCWVLLCM